MEGLQLKRNAFSCLLPSPLLPSFSFSFNLLELFAELHAGLRTGKEEELLIDGKVTDIRRWVHRDGWKPTRGVGEDLLAYEKELSGITNIPGVITRCVNWMKDDFERVREFARKKAEASGVCYLLFLHFTFLLLSFCIYQPSLFFQDKQKMDMWERVALPDTKT
jgi:hypothetical protein